MALLDEKLLWTAHYGKIGNINQPILPHFFYRRKQMRTIPMLALAALLLPLFSGCANLPHYVQLSRDFSVEPIFTNRVILPQYRYYYNGPDTEPTALLALDRDWTLDGLYWTAIDLTEEQLKKWLEQFNLARGHHDDSAHVSISYDGMRVPGPNDQQIGALYARYGQVYVRYGAGKHLTIVGPEGPIGAAFRD
jgi:hypothetical protein